MMVIRTPLYDEHVSKRIKYIVAFSEDEIFGIVSMKR